MDATVLFHSLKGILAAIIAVICLCRASTLDKRARTSVKFTMVLLGMTAFGLGFSMLMPAWMHSVCIVGFMAAIALMLLEGEKRWRAGPPDELLKHEERYPQKDRREFDRREQDRRTESMEMSAGPA